MTILLLLTAIAAILGAIVSASRTYTKLQLESAQSSVQDAIAPEANRSRLQPDLDSEQPQPAATPANESSRIAIPPLMPQPKPEIPLATSLRISDVVEPELSIESTSDTPHHAQPVLEEVEQLEQLEETLNQLAARAIDPERLMRLAVAVELGELAKRGQAVDRVVALLNQLMEDADVEVRVQAGASLAMVPNALT
jgi:hypothetical protein